MMRTDTVFVLVIFCVFAASVLMVIMLGGSTYASMNDIARGGREERVLLSYIRTKIRSADSADAISVGYFHGISSLFVEENFDGRVFFRRIYLYDGQVRELFHEADNELLPADGVPIIRADFLRFEEEEGGLIRVVTDIGDSLIFPRAGGQNATQ